MAVTLDEQETGVLACYHQMSLAALNHADMLFKTNMKAHRWPRNQKFCHSGAQIHLLFYVITRQIKLWRPSIMQLIKFSIFIHVNAAAIMQLRPILKKKILKNSVNKV